MSIEGALNPIVNSGVDLFLPKRLVLLLLLLFSTEEFSFWKFLSFKDSAKVIKILSTKILLY